MSALPYDPNYPGYMIGFQLWLGNQEKMPVVGALIVSPLRLVVSLIQAIAATILFIGMQIKAAFATSDTAVSIMEKSNVCVDHIGLGITFAGMAIANLLTLGLYSRCCKNETQQQNAAGPV